MDLALTKTRIALPPLMGNEQDASLFRLQRIDLNSQVARLTVPYVLVESGSMLA